MALFLAVAVNTGCVERRFLVQAEVPGVAGDAGAKLLVNGQEIGPTPADVYFTYYGKYHFTLIKDGYETLQVDQNISTPWYEWFGIDFISEAIYPWKIRDVRRYAFTLPPAQSVRPEDVLNRANTLRQRAAGVTPFPDSAPPQPPTKQAPKAAAPPQEAAAPAPSAPVPSLPMGVPQ